MIKFMIGGCLAAALAGLSIFAQAQNYGDKMLIIRENARQQQIDKLQEMVNNMQRQADNEMMKRLIHDLVSEKIIGHEKEVLWLALTRDNLIVNGKKQSSAIQRKMASKFIRNPGFGIFYGDPPGNGDGE